MGLLENSAEEQLQTGLQLLLARGTEALFRPDDFITVNERAGSVRHDESVGIVGPVLLTGGADGDRGPVATSCHTAQEVVSACRVRARDDAPANAVPVLNEGPAEASVNRAVTEGPDDINVVS